MPELAVKKRELKERAKLHGKGRRQLVAGDFRARHGDHRIVRTDEPGQIRVHTEEYGDTIEIEQEREQDAEERVQAEKRREAEEHAERECGGRRSGVSSMCRSASSQRRTSARVR